MLLESHVFHWKSCLLTYAIPSPRISSLLCVWAQQNVFRLKLCARKTNSQPVANLAMTWAITGCFPGVEISTFQLQRGWNSCPGWNFLMPLQTRFRKRWLERRTQSFKDKKGQLAPIVSSLILSGGYLVWKHTGRGRLKIWKASLYWSQIPEKYTLSYSKMFLDNTLSLSFFRQNCALPWRFVRNMDLSVRQQIILS